jgi:NACalpha-BTF3-like transcription factor
MSDAESIEEPIEEPIEDETGFEKEIDEMSDALGISEALSRIKRIQSDIEILCVQTGAPRSRVIEVLEENNFDIVNALLFFSCKF